MTQPSTDPASLSDVTVGIKAFLRTDELADTLTALVPFDVHAVVVADDSGMPEGRRELYARFAEWLPLEVLELPYDSGVAVGRNRLFDACATPYFLLLDDDHVVPHNIGDLRDGLAARPDLGGVAGVWSEWGTPRSGACNLYRLGPYIYRDTGGVTETVTTPAGRALYLYDFIPVSALFRAEALADVRWDEAFKIGKAHLDFFLQHKMLGKWRFALAPHVVIGHYPASGTTVPGTRERSAYLRLRRGRERLQRSYAHLKRKWGVWGAVTGTTHLPTDNRAWKMLKHRVLRPFARPFE